MFPLISILFFTTLYAILRYNLFGPVELGHIPVYILNKSISLSAVIAMFIAAWLSYRQQAQRIRWWGTAAFHLTALHIILSVTILTEDYFGKFFGESGMNLTGELTVLTGVLAAYGFIVPRSLFRSQASFRAIKGLAYLLVIAHLIVMGVIGWLKPGDWHGRLPPISLIGFLFSSGAALLFYLTQADEKTNSEDIG